MTPLPIKIIKHLLLMIMILLLPMPVVAQGQVIRVGTLATRGYDACLKKWEPTAVYLTKKIPTYTFQIVPLSFEELIPAVQNQKVDFIICNPGLYVEIEALYGTSRIATINNKVLDGHYSVYGGVIITRADNKTIFTLNDLRGTRFTAVHPDSYGGWLAAWREIHQLGINPTRDFTSLKFAGEQDAVVYAVLAGQADAGTVRTDILERLAKAGKVNLQDIRVLVAEGARVQREKTVFPLLLSTRLYPEWPCSKLMKTPPELATQVAVALMSMGKNDPAAIAAESAGWSYPMNYQPVHDLMMELKIGYYGKLSQVTFAGIMKKYWRELLLAMIVLLIVVSALLVALRLNRRLAALKKDIDKELLERKQIQAELQKSEERYRLLIENLSLAVFVHSQGKIVYVNPAFVIMIKASSSDELIGMRLIELVPPELHDTVAKRIRIMSEENHPLPPIELNLRRLDGTAITVVSSPMPIIFQEQPAILTALHDITERKRGEIELQKSYTLLQIQMKEIEDLQAKLQEQAIRDPLTGLFNRRYLEETLTRELAKASREEYPVSMVMIDIDHFKQVNDTYGHKAGDLMLQSLANLLLNRSRAGDVVCRYGGEEFLMVMPGATLEMTARRAEQWRADFEASCTTYDDISFQATISLGVAVYPLDGAAGEAVMNAADYAMYRAKAAGRNQVAIGGKEQTTISHHTMD
jgi:diguanylate cyclase (GGDEF)-like protein/PAS domain S-box-containing protein